MKNKFIHRSIILTFVSLYLLVSIISTLHVIEFFKLSNPEWLAISLAIAFELGAAACLASLIILDKMNKTLVWFLFGTITLMQMQGNMYYAYVHLADYQGWSELFGLIEEEAVYQKRILSAVSGAILPLVALGFIKSLVDYIKPEAPVSPELIPVVAIKDVIVSNEEKITEEIKIEEPQIEETQIEQQQIQITEDNISYTSEELEEMKDWEETLSDGLEEDNLVEEIFFEEMIHEQSPVAFQEHIESGQVVAGYYGDILIDGNGISSDESIMSPVNSNTPIKKTGITDNSGSVHLNPTRL